jgi:hypothetical protein
MKRNGRLSFPGPPWIGATSSTASHPLTAQAHIPGLRKTLVDKQQTNYYLAMKINGKFSFPGTPWMGATSSTASQAQTVQPHRPG